MFCDFDQKTDFWGPASNFGIPIAAVLDTQKDPEMYALETSLSLSLCEQSTMSLSQRALANFFDTTASLERSPEL